MRRMDHVWQKRGENSRSHLLGNRMLVVHVVFSWKLVCERSERQKKNKEIMRECGAEHNKTGNKKKYQWTHLARSMQVWVRLAEESKYSRAADRTKVTAMSYSNLRMRPRPVPAPRPLPDPTPNDCCLCLSIMSPAKRMLSWLPEHSKLSTKICSTERRRAVSCVKQRWPRPSTDIYFFTFIACLCLLFTFFPCFFFLEYTERNGKLRQMWTISVK